MDIGTRQSPTTHEIGCWCNGLAGLQPPPDKPDWWDIGVWSDIQYTGYKLELFHAW